MIVAAILVSALAEGAARPQGSHTAMASSRDTSGASQPAPYTSLRHLNKSSGYWELSRSGCVRGAWRHTSTAPDLITGRSRRANSRFGSSEQTPATTASDTSRDPRQSATRRSSNMLTGPCANCRRSCLTTQPPQAIRQHRSPCGWTSRNQPSLFWTRATRRTLESMPRCPSRRYLREPWPTWRASIPTRTWTLSPCGHGEIHDQTSREQIWSRHH